MKTALTEVATAHDLTLNISWLGLVNKPKGVTMDDRTRELIVKHGSRHLQALGGPVTKLLRAALAKDPKFTAMLQKRGLSLKETEELDMPVMHHEDQEVAELTVGEGVIELRIGDEADPVESIEVDTDDERAVREAWTEMVGRAAKRGFAEELIDESASEEEIAQDEDDAIAEVCAFLGDVAASASPTQIHDFDTAVEEGDYESALAYGEIIVNAAGSPEQIDEYRRMKGASLAKFRRSLKTQTGAEKAKNRDARRARKRNVANARRMEKRYRRKRARFLGNSTEAGSGADLGENDSTARRPAAPSDALTAGAQSYFASKGVGSFASFGTVKQESATFEGLRGASDAQLMSVLSRLTNSGLLEYDREQGGYSATAELLASIEEGEHGLGKLDELFGLGRKNPWKSEKSSGPTWVVLWKGDAVAFAAAVKAAGGRPSREFRSRPGFEIPSRKAAVKLAASFTREHRDARVDVEYESGVGDFESFDGGRGGKGWSSAL